MHQIGVVDVTTLESVVSEQERSGYDSRAVANKILEIARSKGIDLTIMQLLKLVYFSHGWHLALCGEPLSYHHAQAWQYGPVFPHVYRAYKAAGSAPLTDPIKEKATGTSYTADFSDAAIDIMETVVSEYGREHGFRLSFWTHAPGSPWDRTRKEKGLYKEIDDNWIMDYFKAFIPDGEGVQSRQAN